MKRMTTLVVALVVLMGNLLANPLMVEAANPADCIAPITETESKEATAYELCSSANSWAEYKAVFEHFQCRLGDFKGFTLKELPDMLEHSCTFSGGYTIGAPDEEVDDYAEMLSHAVSLYNEMGFLHFSVKKRGSQIDIVPDDIALTHVGNVVKCYNIPYYENVNAYFEGKEAYYYRKQVICYTCAVAYWNPNGTLEKMEYIPFDEVANLTDEQKPKIDSDFEGTTLVLLCTTDAMLGWANLDGLFQYEDAKGNMEFYNPDFIKYN